MRVLLLLLQLLLTALLLTAFACVRNRLRPVCHFPPLCTLSGLPVVWVNGTRFSTFEQCSASNGKYQADLIKMICAASTANPLPAACHPRGALSV